MAELGRNIPDRIVLSVAHRIYAEYMVERLEKAGCSFDYSYGSTIVPHCPSDALMPVARQTLGSIEKIWRATITSVFRNMKLHNEKDQRIALYYLVMGCLGRSVSLANVYQAEFDQACSRLRRSDIAIAPYLPDDSWVDLVADNVESLIRFLKAVTYDPEKAAENCQATKSA